MHIYMDVVFDKQYKQDYIFSQNIVIYVLEAYYNYIILIILIKKFGWINQVLIYFL